MKLATKMMIEALSGFAASGFTMQETADETGSCYATVARYARDHDIKFLRAGLSCGSERSARMAALYKQGKTLAQIGAEYDVTRERVRQIITKHHGLTAKHGGKTKLAKDRRKQVYAARDVRSMGHWGCPWSQYVILRDMKRPTRAFAAQRRSANDRQIPWEMNLWQWWTVWQQSGHWEDRGRGRGYCMCRKGDSGPYSVDNVYIATGVENIQHYWADVRAGSKSRVYKERAPASTEGAERSKELVRAAVARYQQTPKFKLRVKLRRQGLPKDQRDAIVAAQFGASA